MKQTVTIGIVGVIALIVGLLIGSQVLGGSSAQKVSDLQEQISILDQRINELEGQFAGKDQVSSLQERMNQLEQQVQEIRSGDSQALADRISQLESRIETISTSVSGNGSTPSGGSSPWANVAVVRVNELATRYQNENPEVKKKLQSEVQKIQSQIQSLRQKVQNGELSRSEAQLQATQLQRKLQDVTLNVVAKPIQAAVRAIAKERGYTAVFNIKDTIIYRQEGLMDNITSPVWNRLKTASSSNSSQ
ncbi:MAG: OmpH family outer membrane protein [Candidatus Bipolaricaulia bacterium]